MAIAMNRSDKRQVPTGNNNNNNNGYNGYEGFENGGSWWWTPAGLAVRYAIVAILFAIVLLYFVGGYLHAQRRLRQGRPLLRYHRWMVRQVQQPPYNQAPRNVQYAHYGDPNAPGYNLDMYPPPPPAYHNAEAPPPVYQPPPGASKTMADQYFTETNRGEGSTGATPAATRSR